MNECTCTHLYKYLTKLTTAREFSLSNTSIPVYVYCQEDVKQCKQYNVHLKTTVKLKQYTVTISSIL